MSEAIVELFHFMEQFEILRFLGATGVSGAVFAGIFFPLQWFTRVHYKPSLYIAFVPSLIAGFTLHKYWTFQNASIDLVWMQMFFYTMKRLVFIRINELLLVRLVEHHGFNASVGQALIAMGGLLLNYLVTKLIFSL